MCLTNTTIYIRVRVELEVLLTPHKSRSTLNTSFWVEPYFFPEDIVNYSPPTGLTDRE